MAIGSLDKAGRLEQLQTFARVQVWSGYKAADEVRAEVYDAVLDEVKDHDEADHLTDEYLDRARRAQVEAARGWRSPTDFDRLQAAFADLRAADVVVLEAVDDHWAANNVLTKAADAGERPAGIAYFTHSDVWHAVEHGMLELNVWHADSANVAPGDELLDFVLTTLGNHDIEASFDEGRIEVTVAWQRRPSARAQAL
jgi:hypothetical protein